MAARSSDESQDASSIKNPSPDTLTDESSTDMAEGSTSTGGESVVDRLAIGTRDLIDELELLKQNLDRLDKVDELSDSE